MNVNWINMDTVLEHNEIDENEEIIIFYETDPMFKEIVGFDPKKGGLRVFTVGYYPMRPSFESEDGEISFEQENRPPIICSIYGTTKTWLEESRILNQIEHDLERLEGFGE